MPIVAAAGLRAMTHLIASRMGSEAVEAEQVADHLVRANLAGHDSHGVGMLPTYVRLLHDGLLQDDALLFTAHWHHGKRNVLLFTTLLHHELHNWAP